MRNTIDLDDDERLDTFDEKANDDMFHDDKQPLIGEESIASLVDFRVVIFPTFLFFLVLFAVVPMSSQVTIEQVCIQINSDSCSDANVSSRASMVILYCNTATYLSGLLTTGFYSSIANIYGRKLVMMISLFGLGVYSLMYSYVAAFSPNNFLMIMVIASFVMGVTGSYTTFIMGSFSYVADSTMHDPKNRNYAYSLTEASLYFGKIVGPIASGLYANYYGFKVPFLACAVIVFCATLFVVFMKESLPPSLSSRRKEVVLNPFQTLDNISLIFTHRPKLGQSPLPLVAVSFFLYYLALMGWVSVIYLYLKFRFNWGAFMLGLFDSANGLIQALSMTVMPHIVTRVCRHEFKLITWVHIGYLCR